MKLLAVIALFLVLPVSAHEDVYGVGINQDGKVSFSYHSIAEMKVSPEPWGWYTNASVGENNVNTVGVEQVATYNSIIETVITTTEGSTTTIDVESPGNSNFGHCRTNASGKCNQGEEVVVVDGTTTTTTNTYDIMTLEDVETKLKTTDYEFILNAGVNYQMTKTLYPFIGIGVMVEEKHDDYNYEPNVNLGILYFKGDYGAEIGFNTANSSVNINMNMRF